jgi:hypothetical protein
LLAVHDQNRLAFPDTGKHLAEMVPRIRYIGFIHSATIDMSSCLVKHNQSPQGVELDRRKAVPPKYSRPSWGHHQTTLPLYRLVFVNFSRLDMLAGTLAHDKKLNSAAKELDQQAEAIVTDIVGKR